MTPKWVSITRLKMITHFSEIFKEVDIKKTSLRNLLFVILAVAVETKSLSITRSKLNATVDDVMFVLKPAARLPSS